MWNANNKPKCEISTRSVTLRTKAYFIIATNLRKFRKGEDGSFVIFSLFIFVCMLLVGGIAVDLIRHESARVKLQNTLDRAVLAAASLDQTLDPEAVVQDYFAKANMSSFLTSVTVDEGLNYRSVSAQTTVDIQTFFMNMSGIDTLTAPASGSAEERVEKVEISMVLDVSGSMRGSKMNNLIDAGKDFVDTILEDQEGVGTYSISIVPYAAQVAAGPQLTSLYNVSTEHAYSHCVHFTGSHFNSAALSTTTPLTRADDIGVWYLNPGDKWDGRVCPPAAESHRNIMVASDDISDLKDYIDDLEAGGNTSTDIGIKWGTALLDPSARPVFDAMISSNDIPNEFSGRPYNYDEPDILKVLVVMTDGVNTYQKYLKPEFRDGLSDVWFYRDNDEGEDQYSIWDEDEGEYYWAHPSNYNSDGPWWNMSSAWHDTPRGGTASHRMSYRELWHRLAVPQNAAYNYYAKDNQTIGTYYDWRDNKVLSVTGSMKDTRMDNICTAAKTAGIVIYTIGFEVSDSSAAKMSSCATSPAHFFRVEGVEISDAFEAIAANIHQLRLTN